MTTRTGNHDTEDVPALQDSASMDLVPPDINMPGWERESCDEYSKEPDTIHLLAKLQGTIPATSGPTHPLETCHPPTHTHGRDDTGYR